MNQSMVGLVLVGLCAVIEGFAQVFWKLSSLRVEARGLWILAGAGAYLAEIGLYTLALTKIDVTIAFACGSLSFVAVAVLSRVWLKEKISLVRGLGLFLILCGVVLMGREA